MKTFEIYFSDLFVGAHNPAEMNWDIDILPLATYEFEEGKSNADMGLFDFDINDNTQEQKRFYDISADKGKTWTAQWMTPSEMLMEFMTGHMVRSHYTNRTIIFTPGNSTYPITMTIPVPQDRDAEEYIDEVLDGMLNEFLQYNSEWEFV
jgi:hypothetical protein